ncbi:hypothetical protein [Terricaulis sp.]|uniref:hypothetical protein n=1 Tax=Terricaulis sp. TaxID=2768686 RepID=UPI003783F384
MPLPARLLMYASPFLGFATGVLITLSQISARQAQWPGSAVPDHLKSALIFCAAGAIVSAVAFAFAAAKYLRST